LQARVGRTDTTIFEVPKDFVALSTVLTAQLTQIEDNNTKDEFLIVLKPFVDGFAWLLQNYKLDVGDIYDAFCSISRTHERQQYIGILKEVIQCCDYLDMDASLISKAVRILQLEKPSCVDPLVLKHGFDLPFESTAIGHAYNGNYFGRISRRLCSNSRKRAIVSSNGIIIVSGEIQRKSEGHKFRKIKPWTFRLDEEEFQKLADINPLSAFEVAKEYLRKYMAPRQGNVIDIISLSGAEVMSPFWTQMTCSELLELADQADPTPNYTPIGCVIAKNLRIFNHLRCLLEICEERKEVALKIKKDIVFGLLNHTTSATNLNNIADIVDPLKDFPPSLIWDTLNRKNLDIYRIPRIPFFWGAIKYAMLTKKYAFKAEFIKEFEDTVNQITPTKEYSDISLCAWRVKWHNKHHDFAFDWKCGYDEKERK